MVARRLETLSKSEQLTLGELILKLEMVKNKELPIVFDKENKFPKSVGSWRGSYCELAIFYYDEKPVTIKCSEFLETLKNTVGETFGGWKGGDFTMHRQTPVWVTQDRSTSSGWGENSIGVVDIKETDSEVVIVTKDIEY